MHALNEVNKVITSITYYPHRHNQLEDVKWLTPDKMAVGTLYGVDTGLGVCGDILRCRKTVCRKQLDILAVSLDIVGFSSSVCKMLWGI